MSWFIESWRPLAGYAFAVHRNYTYDSLVKEERDERSWLDADEIYAVAPPDFSPLACASEATALWATRGPFQHKFLQPDGLEYRFDSLDQLIELVRRVYVAAGVNPPLDLDIRRPPLPEVPLFSEEWRRLRDALDERDTAAIESASPDAPHLAHRSILDTAARLMSDSMDACSAAIRDLSLTSLTALVESRAAGADVSTAETQAWAVLVAEMNAWGEWHEAANEIERALRSSQRLRPRMSPPCWPFGAAARLDDAVFNGVLSRVPGPRVRLYELPKTLKLDFLGDHLALAMADPRYWRALSSPQEALPLFICALTIAATTSWDFRGGNSGDEVKSVRKRAAYWLVERLPNGRMPVPGAELVIDQILDHRSGARVVPGIPTP